MELPVVLVAEDDDQVQAIIEDALNDGGFDVATVATAEEGLALITRRADQYKALLTDIKPSRSDDGLGTCQAGQGNSSYPPGGLHDRRCRPRVAISGRAREHPDAKAVCSSSGSNSHHHVTQQVVLA